MFLVSVHLTRGMLRICYVMVMFASVFPETFFYKVHTLIS